MDYSLFLVTMEEREEDNGEQNYEEANLGSLKMPEWGKTVEEGIEGGEEVYVAMFPMCFRK